MHWEKLHGSVVIEVHIAGQEVLHVTCRSRTYLHRWVKIHLHKMSDPIVCTLNQSLKNLQEFQDVHEFPVVQKTLESQAVLQFLVALQLLVLPVDLLRNCQDFLGYHLFPRDREDLACHHLRPSHHPHHLRLSHPSLRNRKNILCVSADCQYRVDESGYFHLHSLMGLQLKHLS